MYTHEQILKGFRSPKFMIGEADRLWRTEIRPRLPHDIGIKGNYWTGNVGNRAVGEILRERLLRSGTTVKLFGKGVDSSQAPVRMIGGGGGFHDRYGPHQMRRRLNFVSGNRGAIVATGVPGIRTEEGRRMVREGLPEIDLITVRSQLDFEQLDPSRDCNAHVTACPTLLFSNPNEDSNNRDGVNFLPWFLGERKQYGAHIGDSQDLSDYFGYDSNISVGDARDAYITNAQRICSQLQNPIFIPFTKGDERFARNYLDVEIQPYTFSVTETFRRVSEVDRMVTTRFHCLVFATVCEKPTLALAYAPKVSSLAERLGIPSYKPHHEIPVEFHNVSNLGSVRRSAMENFRLLDEYVLRYGENRSYSIGEDNLTDPYSIAH